MIYSTAQKEFAVMRKGTPYRALPPFCSTYRAGRSYLLLISHKLHKGVLFGNGRCDIEYDDERDIMTLHPSINGKLTVTYNCKQGSQIISIQTFISFIGKDFPHGRHPATLLPDGSIEIKINELL